MVRYESCEKLSKSWAFVINVWQGMRVRVIYESVTFLLYELENGKIPYINPGSTSGSSFILLDFPVFLLIFADQSFPRFL